MNSLLSHSVAVVTGAAQGNGRAIALGLARHGAAVAVGDLQEDAVAEVADEIRRAGGSAFSARLDVSDRNSCMEFRQGVERSLGAAAVLVNNAGVIRRCGLDEPGFEEDWDVVFRVNVTGTRNMVRAFLPDLRATGGRIVNLGSIMSFSAGARLSAYAASKGAVLQLTKALAQELAPAGIRVNAIAPGVIATPMTEATRQAPQAIGRFMAHTPMGRVGEPEELVGPVVFLASSLSSYVTGVMVPVDGGYLTA